jgi:polyphosphate kinase 2 (PPK2 family)
MRRSEIVSNKKTSGAKTNKLDNSFYEKALKRLQKELVKLQQWIKRLFPMSTKPN